MILIYLTTIIFIMTLAAGAMVFIPEILGQSSLFSVGEALASGVFLGVGLLHMLPDAHAEFLAQHIQYPLAFLLAAITFLLLLLFEHVHHEISHNHQHDHSGFPTLAVIMLSIHSFLAGAALGAENHLSQMIVIGGAILIHKWAESFSLAVQLRKNGCHNWSFVILFGFFALMVPLGVIIGANIASFSLHTAHIKPILTAQAAGTFMYFATIHGLDRAVMVDKCCSMREYLFVVLGFSIMAVLSLWI